jgi:hypothetical protein
LGKKLVVFGVQIFFVGLKPKIAYLKLVLALLDIYAKIAY